MLLLTKPKEGFDDAGTGECGSLLLFALPFGFGNSKALHNGHRVTVLRFRLRREWAKHSDYP